MRLDLTVDEKTFKKFKIDTRNELKEIEYLLNVITYFLIYH